MTKHHARYFELQNTTKSGAQFLKGKTFFKFLGIVIDYIHNR